MVLGERQKVLFGKGYIEDVLCGLRFKISPRSFYQINPVQTKVLYNKAIGYAELKGSELVFDAYCGIGTIGLCAAGHAKKIIGVELNPAAVKDAKQNAQLNGIENAEFYAADAGDFMEEAAAEGWRPDVVFMDPPRAGSSRKFLKSLLRTSPQKIVYISCNPETMARDLKILTRDYRVEKLCPVDMFPHTEHVETVVQLVRKKPDTYIDITVDMDELDLTSSEAKATYDEIKDYIFDKHCVKVSSLYIAQIKQKHGIIERDCYNNSKKDNTKQPQCPPEKVKLMQKNWIGKSEGARVACGGERMTEGELAKGCFMKPTLLVDVDNHMRVAQEEIFGPVACVIRFHDEDQVIEMANDNAYGLGGAVWTRDINRAIRVSRGIETGRMWVNTYNAIPEGAPFGGYKASGIGRETHKVILEHYTQMKNIMINLSESPSGFYPEK